jgi:hypothetical protein
MKRPLSWTPLKAKPCSILLPQICTISSTQRDTVHAHLTPQRSFDDVRSTTLSNCHSLAEIGKREEGNSLVWLLCGLHKLHGNFSTGQQWYRWVSSRLDHSSWQSQPPAGVRVHQVSAAGQGGNRLRLSQGHSVLRVVFVGEMQGGCQCRLQVWQIPQFRMKHEQRPTYFTSSVHKTYS